MLRATQRKSCMGQSLTARTNNVKHSLIAGELSSGYDMIPGILIEDVTGVNFTEIGL